MDEGRHRQNVGRGGIMMGNVHIHPTEALALGEFTMVSHDFEGSTMQSSLTASHTISC